MNICTKILNKWLLNQIQQWYIKNIIHYNQVLFQEYKHGSTSDLTNVSHQQTKGYKILLSQKMKENYLIKVKATTQ